ncbi:MAG TPA: glycosyltransferase family 87 protein [Anaerolineales bacterium]|nr:glycosyltransferase family 87 protein [Anaerolineales bacterium]
MSAMAWFSRNKPLRYTVATLGLAAGLLVLSQYADRLRINDFIGYWSAARLNLNRQDPFSIQLLLDLQRQAGYQYDYPHIVWNPPWVMSLITPLGWLARPLAQMLWLLLNTGAVLISADKAWQIYGGAPRLRWVALLVGFTFTPTFFALAWTGQISPLLLPGIVGFLIYYQEPQKGWLAGLLAALAAIKPQIPYLFFIALLLWCLSRRRWDILAGFAATLAGATLIALAINPPLIHYYIQALLNTPPAGWATPTIGTYLRLWLSPTSFWLQFIPPILGAGWLIFHWYRQQQKWNWVEQMPILLLASFITSAYTWTYDQVLLTLAAIQGFVWATSHRRPVLLLAASAAYLALNYIYLRLHFRLDDLWFIWFTPVLLLWYLAVRWLHNKTISHETV